MQMKILAVVAALGLGLAGVPASALIIDNAEVGPFDVVDAAGGLSASGEQGPLPQGSVVGGARRVIVSATSGTATASLVTTGGDDAIVLSSTGGGLFNLYYDGTPGSEGLALGQDLSALVDITLSATATGAGASVRAYLYDSDGFVFSDLYALGTGTVAIPLTDFAGLDLSDIQQIRFFISGISSTNTVSIFEILAVPEPSTALLLGMGLTGLALRRRR